MRHVNWPLILQSLLDWLASSAFCYNLQAGSTCSAATILIDALIREPITRNLHAYLTTCLQVVLLRPSGLGEGSPHRPHGSGSATATLPGMWCQVTVPNAVSGQASLVIWPLYSIYNALPMPLHWHLSKADSDSLATRPHDSIYSKPSQGLVNKDQGLVQPGEESPLPVAMDPGPTLSFRLGSEQLTPGQASGASQPTPAASNTAWSSALLTQNAGRGDPNVRFPIDQSAAVPDAGLWQAIDIPQSSGGTLSCMLVAQPGLDQTPMVTLSLLPHAVLHNSLPFPVCLEPSFAERQAPVAAGSSQALDWSLLDYRPKKVALAITESHGNRLQSQAFALDANHDTQLIFSSTMSDPQHLGSADTHTLTFYAAVRVQNEPFEIRPGQEEKGTGHTMEVTHISVTPACFVTNLTQHQLRLQLQGQQPRPVGHQPQLPGLQPQATGGKSPPYRQLPQPLGQSPPPSAQQPRPSGQQPQQSQRQAQDSQQQQQQQRESWDLTCGPSQTMPVLNAWRHLQHGPAQRPNPHPAQAAAAAALAVTVRLDSTVVSSSAPSSLKGLSYISPSLLIGAPPTDNDTTVLQTVDVPALGAGPGGEQSHAHEGIVALMQPSGRRHLLLKEPQQEQPVLVAYRSILNQGRLHLVFFTDPQPPCVIHSAASVALEVVWCTLHRDKRGVLQEQSSKEVISLPAGASFECSPSSSLPMETSGKHDLAAGIPSEVWFC